MRRRASCSCRFRGAGHLILEQHDARAAVEALLRARDLRENPEACLTDEQDVEGAVLPLLDMRDPAETAHEEDRGIAGHRVDAVRADGDHADLLRAREGVARHLAIARLEDEERHRAVRQQDDIREREQGQRVDHTHGRGA